MAYIGGRKAVRGRITRGCGIGRPLGMWNSQSNREHGFLFDAASFWTRMTRKAAAYFSEGRRLAGVSRAAGCCMSGESRGNELGATRAITKGLRAPSPALGLRSSCWTSGESCTSRTMRVGSRVTIAALRAVLRARTGWILSAATVGAEGIRRLKRPASSDQSLPAAPRRASEACGETQ